MKAITICQPWAWLIVNGIKTVENRTWPTNYRGSLAIHAGKGRQWLHICDELRARIPELPALDELVYGAVIGMVDMVDCVSVAEYQAKRRRAGLKPDPFATGPWCHVYARPRQVEPVECNGSLSLWAFNAPALSLV